MTSTRSDRHPGRCGRGSVRGRRRSGRRRRPSGHRRPPPAAVNVLGTLPETSRRTRVGERRRVAAQREADEVPGVGPGEEQRLDSRRSDGTAVRTVTVAPSRTRVPAGGSESEHQPLGLAGASRPELDVVARGPRAAAAPGSPSSANSEGIGSRGWPVGQRRRPPPPRPRDQADGHERAGAAGPLGGAADRAFAAPRAPAGRGPRRGGSACAARAAPGRRRCRPRPRRSPGGRHARSACRTSPRRTGRSPRHLRGHATA